MRFWLFWALLFFVHRSFGMKIDPKRALTYYNNDEWKTCINTSNRKWCIPEGSGSNYGDWCRSWHTSGYCSSSGNNVCSNSTDIDSGSEYILCPTASWTWGSSNIHLTAAGDSHLFTQSWIDTNYVCVYQITTSSSSVGEVDIFISKFFKKPSLTFCRWGTRCWYFCFYSSWSLQLWFRRIS